VTETTQTDSPTAARKSGGLSSMLLPELKSLAGQLGIPGASGMRKADLISAISSRQVPATRSERPADAPAREDRPRRERSTERPAREDRAPQADVAPSEGEDRTQGQAPEGDAPQGERPRRDRGDRQQNDRQQGDRPQGDRAQNDRGDRPQGNDRQNGDRQQGDRQQGDRQQNDRQQGDRQQGDRPQNDRQQGNDRPQAGQDSYDDDRGGRSCRRRRGRDRGE